MKQRLDKYLVEAGLVPTRSKARLLVEEGKVLVNDTCPAKPGLLVDPQDTIQVAEEKQYVGRGAQKLLAALEAFPLSPQNLVCADIGASTGGFTQVLLEKGAKKVYAIDVGHGQLATELKNDPRVINFEGVNVRHGVELPEMVELVVIDVSFISLRLILPEVVKLLKPGAPVVMLIKPQFEASRETPRDKKGVLAIETARQVVFEFEKWCLDQGHRLKQLVPSPLKGKEGNQEFLAYFIVS